MDCSTPSFPLLHHLLKFAQAHVHWVGDAIQPSHPLLPLSPPPSVFSHYQGLFQWVNFSHSGGQSVRASASVLPMNIQDWFPLGLIGLILLSKGLSRDFSSTTVRRHQFFGAQPFYCPTLISIHLISCSHFRLLEKTIALTIRTLVGKVISLLFNMLSRFVIAFLPRSRQGVHDLTQFSSLLFREMTVTTFVQIRRLRFRGVKQFTPDHTG